MKHLFTILFLASSLGAFAQTTTGKVTDATTGAGIVGATVKLADMDKGTVTDAGGAFLLEGKGTLQITSVGYVSQKIKTSGGDIAIELMPDITQLQSVEVMGRLARDYTSDYSFAATRTATPNKQIPQSISTVTKELMADRQAFQLADAVKIASGVIPSSYYNQYAIRGISQNEEGQIINGMRTRQYYFLQPLTANIERVEVVKGPASATMSSVDPGGSINLVTKKPLAVDRREVSLSAGSFSTFRGTLDFTGPLNEAKTLLYRVNGAYQEARSFRDLVASKAVLLSPSFSYVPDDKTSINVELIYSNMAGTLDRGQPIFGAVAGKTNLNSTPISLNLGASNDFFKSKEVIITGSLSRKITKGISFNAAYMKQSWREDLQEHRTTNAFAPDIASQPVTSLAVMQFVQRQQYWNIDNLNAYFTFDVSRGKLKNKLLVGYDLQSWEKMKGGGQNAARGFLLKDGSVAGSFVLANAANYQTIKVGDRTLPRPNVPYFDLANPSYTVRNTSDYTLNVRSALPAALTTNNAVYVQNQFQFSKMGVLLSLRQEWFRDITNYESPGENSFNNAKLLPRVGLTYAATSNVTVYATYLEGFQPQSNTVTLMPSTGAFFGAAQSAAQFAPLTSDLKEVGVKADVLAKRFQLTASVYEINQRNILMNANDPAQPDRLVTRGSDRSRGFELDLAGYLNPNWQLNASYSYINAIITNDRDENLIGKRKENTPVNSANLWTRYNVKSIGFGLGLQHNGSRIPWFTRAFETPAYTLLDLAIYYSPAKSKIQLALNANNVTNQTYWIGAQTYQRLFPGAPRNLILTATFKF